MMYYNSIAQELRINDSVVYDELDVEYESGLYAPFVKINRNYRIGKIIDFKVLKKYIKAIVEFNYDKDKEIKEININHLIKF